MIEIRRRASRRGRTPDGLPNPIDVHVGNRLRLRRTLLGLSQERLGAALGLTFQQIQKYEKGMNRVGASRLWDISKVLGVSISFFFEDMDEDVASQSPRMINLGEEASVLQLAEEQQDLDDDPLSKEETLILVRDFYLIQDRSVAENIKTLISSLAHRTNAKRYEDDEE